MNEPFLAMKSISKRFPGVMALDNVDFELSRGEVRAIVGKNGAGKSTLIKILTGIYPPDSGKIFIDGENVDHVAPDVMHKKGVRAIYQEIDLVPYFTIAEAVMLNNNLLGSKKKFVIDKKSMNHKVYEIFKDKLNIEINPNKLIKDLSVADKQLVQIARSVVQEPKLMIFDEPTAPLSAEEIKKLFEIIRGMKSSGIPIIYISHRLEEIFEIANSITILRDGKKIADLSLSETSENEIIQLMVGRETLKDKKDYLHKKEIRSEKVLEVDNLKNERIKEISFVLHKGEILGLFGAEGAGQAEIVRSIYGLLPKKGNIKIEGQKVFINNPFDAIRNGIGYVSRDREENLIKTFTLAENITLPYLDAYSVYGLVKKSREEKMAQRIIEELEISTRNTKTIVNFLSGGNQQKVAIGRWLPFPLKVLMLDYPTIGIDVQAKLEIYHLLKIIASRGTAIIIITPEYEEIKTLCDRVLIMREGYQKVILNVEGIDEDTLLKYAIGSSTNEEVV